MLVSEITVEVRNKTLDKVGIVKHEDLDIEVLPEHNGIGTWKLTLRRDHQLATDLAAPGSGIIVSTPYDVILSGPTVQPETTYSTDDPIGTVTFSGVSDTVALADALAFPQPSNGDATTQTVAQDKRTGPAETVIHGYVNANIGPSAPAARRKNGLTMGSDDARGGTITKSARFTSLHTLVTEIAVAANLGFRIVQRSDGLVFETYQVSDKSKSIRLSIANGNVASEKVAVVPPTITRAIVGGSGASVNRAFLATQTTDSVAAEELWGRRIEKFIDARQTIDVSEYTQAANEALADGGFTGTSLQVIPTDTAGMRFGVDWYLGDTVGAEVDHQEVAIVVTGAVLKLGPQGFQYGVTVGDNAPFDPMSGLTGTVKALVAKVDNLETNGAPQTQAGVVTSTIAIGNTFADATVFFDQPYASVPIATASLNASSSATYSVMVNDLTTDYIKIRFYRPNGAATTATATGYLNWIATPATQ